MKRSAGLVRSRSLLTFLTVALVAALCGAAETSAYDNSSHSERIADLQGSTLTETLVVPPSTPQEPVRPVAVDVWSIGAPLAANETDIEGFFIRFGSPLSETDRTGLVGVGVTFAQVIPPATYLVHLGPGALESVTSHPDFVGLSPIAESDKLAPSLQAEAIAADATVNAADGSSVTGQDDVLGHVEFFLNADLTESVAAATNAGLTVLNPDRFSLGRWLEVEGSPAALASLAANPMVVSVSEGSRWRTTTNVVAQGLSNSDDLQLDGLTGDGVVVGIWDGGQIGTDLPSGEHGDLVGRVTNHQGWATNYHSTHVGGTIAGDGTGNADAEGMAPDAELHLWDFYGSWSSEMEDASVDEGVTVSNHSWGYCMGRHSCGGSGWEGEDGFGAYDVESQLADAVVIATNQIVVKSAGNDRNDCGFQAADADNCDGDLAGDGEYYDNVTDFGNAKNVITVGAVNDDGVSITSFSSAGPADDGRIKPDVVANGAYLLSTWNTDMGGGNYYASISGTSMSAPVVTGIVAQLAEHYGNLNNDADLPPDLAKALLINTSTDIGRFGPDYLYGYGLVNAAAAKDQISPDFNRSGSVADTEVDEYFVDVAAGTTALEVALNWIDPAGVINSPAPDIVNNLDLELVDPDGFIIHYPWSGPGLATPAALSTRAGPNAIDTAEKVDVENPLAGRWIVRIVGTGVTSGPQAYALVSSSALVLANDMFADAGSIGGPSATATGTNIINDVGFTTEPNEPACFLQNLKSAWWKWTAPNSNTVTINTIGSDFNTVLGVYTGDTLAALDNVACNDDTGSPVIAQSSVTFEAVIGTTYRIQVAGYANATGNITLNTTGPSSAPTALGAVHGNGEVTVSWGAPVDDGGVPVSGYTVTASPGSESCVPVSTSTSCVVSGLTNGIEYTFAVVAANVNGSSVASVGVAATPSLVRSVEQIGVDCTVAQPHPFGDVDETSFAFGSVGCIYSLGVTEGINAFEYGPGNTVTRAEMAAFIERLYNTLTA